LIEILTPATNGLAHEFSQQRAVIDFREIKNGLQGYIWDFPCLCNGAPHLNIGVFDSRIAAEESRANLPEILQRHLDERGWNISVDLMGHPERWFHPEDVYSKSRVLLVGDAAGVEPWLGEGISLALAYGPVAAATILSALACDDYSFADYRRNILTAKLGKILRRNRLVARLFYAPKIFSVLPVCGRILQAYLDHRIRKGIKINKNT
jgi:flavin-dependent dehydrogenase